MTDLVTGANGFIGSALCAGLVAAGRPVRGLILSGTDPGSLPALGVEVVEGDICQPDSLKGPMGGVQRVFHLAALASDWGPEEHFMRVNATGTQNVLVSARNAGVQRVIHMSSLAVHPFCGHVDADENTPTGNDVNGYCTSKIMAESLVRRAAVLQWFSTTIIRPGAIIVGPGDTTAFVQLAPVLERGGLPLIDDGAKLTCFSCVENLVAGLLLAAGHGAAENQTFILTDDRRISLRAYLEAVCHALGTAPRFRSVPGSLARAAGWALERLWKLADSKTSPPINSYRTGLVSRDFHFSCALAKRLLGYKPVIELETGLRNTVAWYRAWQATR